jgi:hypothetical protein
LPVKSNVRASTTCVCVFVCVLTIISQFGVYGCKYAYIHTLTHTHTQTHIHTTLNIAKHTHTNTHIHTSLNIVKHTHIHTHTHTHTHTHIYIQTHAEFRNTLKWIPYKFLILKKCLIIKISTAIKWRKYSELKKL